MKDHVVGARAASGLLFLDREIAVPVGIVVRALGAHAEDPEILDMAARRVEPRKILAARAGGGTLAWGSA
ncbi:MAG: hypothetical protein AMXMBFR56_04640 [Polyangiaceae bacterium]